MTALNFISTANKQIEQGKCCITKDNLLSQQQLTFRFRILRYMKKGDMRKPSNKHYARQREQNSPTL